MGTLVLVRHAEAIKNTEDRHGGPGTALTAAGVLQVEALRSHLRSRSLTPTAIISSPVRQARESAEHLSQLTGITHSVSKQLDPLDLGVVGGLSRKELEQTYPDLHALMVRWWEGELEISDLILPGAEDYWTFFNRGRAFIDSVSPVGVTCVVGTRSILILLISVLLNRNPGRGGGYREVRMGCSDAFVFRQDASNWYLDQACSHLAYPNQDFTHVRTAL